MAGKFGKKGFVNEINVTPFVDVMLVLLIIFMVTAPMMDEGLDVVLPETRAVSALPTKGDHLVLTINNKSEIYLDTYLVGIDDLEQQVRSVVVEQNKELFLRADTTVPYGLVVAVMGRVRSAGVEKMSVVAEREGTK